MAKKRHKIETSCPQCGCSSVSHLNTEEIRERFGDVTNVEIECYECVIRYTADMKEACPEWDEECRVEE
jgi:hypothetical protein